MPFECEESTPEAWRATAGEPPPAPLLQSDEEVIRAFEGWVRRRLFGSWWEAALYGLVSEAADALGLRDHVPAPGHLDRRLGATYEAIEAGEIDYRIEQAVSWAPSRCDVQPARKGSLFLEASWDDWEVAALLTLSGELRQFSGGTKSQRGPVGRLRLPSLEDARATIAAEAGGPVEHAQYVLTYGYPYCHGIPCVAAVRGETLYLLEISGRLFAFGLDPRPEEEVLPPPPKRCIGAPCAGYPYVVRVVDRWLAGELLSGPTRRPLEASPSP